MCVFVVCVCEYVQFESVEILWVVGGLLWVCVSQEWTGFVSWGIR